MTFKCKICGGETIVDSLSGIMTCEYCGSKQALPLFTDDSERLLYESGNSYLSHNEYDKAENVFNQLLTIKPNAAELYWALVLCKYGVAYVKDPKTQKYIPTCNRTHYSPIFSDKNYQKAIELSEGDTRALFEEDAKTIDDIQKGIIAISKKEKPFDVFISYKETDANGNRTKDSVEAQKLYEKLTEAGYKVFFSRITLEDKIGTEYEPYIYAALYSSKVMITVSSSKENIDAVWVKNEWSRFLSLRQNDSSKTLLPLYFDMNKADLPEEFALLSSFNMADNGFEDELIRGIKKLIPLPIIKAQKRKQMTKILSISAAAVCAVALLVTIIFLPGYLKEKKRLNAYTDAQNLFASAQYKEASEAFTLLGDYKDSADMVKKCEFQPDYDAAMQLYYDGKYAESAWAFDKLGNYEDSKTQKTNAELSWRKSLATVTAENKYNSMVSAFYVTPNGTIANLETGEENIKVSDHGKAISLSNWCVLYEDGTLGETTTEINGIAQIVPENWVLGQIALKTDGTVLIEEFDECNYDYVKYCFEPATEWRNIVQLSAHTESYGNASFAMALAGVDAYGDVYMCVHHDWYDESDYRYESFMEHTDIFNNVRTLNIEMSTDYDNKVRYVNAVALTNDGKLVTYINGQKLTRKADGLVDAILVDDEVYTLSSDGKVQALTSKRVLANDVVRISDAFTYSKYSLITRSGAIVDNGGCKTNVYDEWLVRM